MLNLLFHLVWKEVFVVCGKKCFGVLCIFCNVFTLYVHVSVKALCICCWRCRKTLVLQFPLLKSGHFCGFVWWRHLNGFSLLLRHSRQYCKGQRKVYFSSCSHMCEAGSHTLCSKSIFVIFHPEIWSCVVVCTFCVRLQESKLCFHC